MWKRKSRGQGQSNAAQLQLGSSAQLRYRNWETMMPTIKQTMYALGNQLGNTRRTMTGVGLIGNTVRTRLYSTYRKSGCASVSSMGSGPWTIVAAWSTPHSLDYTCALCNRFPIRNNSGVLSQTHCEWSLMLCLCML